MKNVTKVLFKITTAMLAFVMIFAAMPGAAVFGAEVNEEALQSELAILQELIAEMGDIDLTETGSHKVATQDEYGNEISYEINITVTIEENPLLRNTLDTFRTDRFGLSPSVTHLTIDHTFEVPSLGRRIGHTHSLGINFASGRYTFSSATAHDVNYSWGHVGLAPTRVILSTPTFLSAVTEFSGYGVQGESSIIGSDLFLRSWLTVPNSGPLLIVGPAMTLPGYSRP